MKKMCVAIAALVGWCGVSVAPAKALTVSPTGPVISKMCGDLADPVGCHWCAPTSGKCYIVTDCHGNSCTIVSGPAPTRVKFHPTVGSDKFTPRPIKDGLPNSGAETPTQPVILLHKLGHNH